MKAEIFSQIPKTVSRDASGRKLRIRFYAQESHSVILRSVFLSIMSKDEKAL